MQILIMIMFINPLSNLHFFNFFFAPLIRIPLPCLWVHWSFPSFDLVSCWNFLLIFFSSVIVFFNSVFLSDIFFLIVKILTLFMHCPLDMGEHFDNHYFNALGDKKLSIFISLRSSSTVLSCPFVSNIFLCFYTFFDCLCCCMNIIYHLSSLYGVLSWRIWTLSCSSALAFDCLSNIYGCPSNIYGCPSPILCGSWLLRICQYLPVSQRGRSQYVDAGWFEIRPSCNSI